MPDPSAIHAATMAQWEDYYGADGIPHATWNGKNYPCFASDAKQSANLGITGFDSESDFIVLIRVALFTANVLPQKEQTLTYLPAGQSTGLSYRIDSVQTPMGSPFIVLNCVNTSRGIGLKK